MHGSRAREGVREADYDRLSWTREDAVGLVGVGDQVLVRRHVVEWMRGDHNKDEMELSLITAERSSGDGEDVVAWRRMKDQGGGDVDMESLSQEYICAWYTNYATPRDLNSNTTYPETLRLWNRVMYDIEKEKATK